MMVAKISRLPEALWRSRLRPWAEACTARDLVEELTHIVTLLCTYFAPLDHDKKDSIGRAGTTFDEEYPSFLDT